MQDGGAETLRNCHIRARNVRGWQYSAVVALAARWRRRPGCGPAGQLVDSSQPQEIAGSLDPTMPVVGDLENGRGLGVIVFWEISCTCRHPAYSVDMGGSRCGWREGPAVRGRDVPATEAGPAKPSARCNKVGDWRKVRRVCIGKQGRSQARCLAKRHTDDGSGKGRVRCSMWMGSGNSISCWRWYRVAGYEPELTGMRARRVRRLARLYPGTCRWRAWVAISTPLQLGDVEQSGKVLEAFAEQVLPTRQCQSWIA